MLNSPMTSLTPSASASAVLKDASTSVASTEPVRSEVFVSAS